MKALRFISKIGDKVGNIKPIFAILALIVFLIGRDLYQQVFKPININPDGISKREYKKQIEQSNEKISETLIKIEVYQHKLDSCMFVLDSIQYRKRSNLDTLQRFFNNY